MIHISFFNHSKLQTQKILLNANTNSPFQQVVLLLATLPVLKSLGHWSKHAQNPI